MAPISKTVEPQPRFGIRQLPAPYEVTLTITRDTTTFTSILTLGSAAVPTNPAATTTAASTPTQTLAPVPAQSNGNNNGVVIGAVLGTFLGLLVLLTLVWKCCFNPQSALYRRDWDDDSSVSYTTDSHGSSRSSRRRRVRRRGGWGDNRRRHGVRRPERAYVRRERRGSGSGSFEGSESTWRDEKRRGSGVVVRNGMLGWAFGGNSGGRRRGSGSGRRRDWVDRERVRMRFTTDD